MNSDLTADVATTTSARCWIVEPGSANFQTNVATAQRNISKYAPANVTQSLLDLSGKSQASLTLQ